MTQSSIESATEYSNDVWDYVPDRLPKRQDRDRLVERAKSDPEFEKRVRIWDYFFRLTPEDVGKPIRKELSKIESDIPKEQQAGQLRQAHAEVEIQRIQQQITQLPLEAEDRLAKSIEKVQGRFAGRASRRRTYGIILAILAGIAGLITLALLYLFIGNGYYNGAINSSWCCLPVIALLGGTSFLAFRNAQTDIRAQDLDIAREREISQKSTEERLAQLQGQIQQIQQDLLIAESEVTASVQQMKARQQALQTQLSDLIKQIPWTPSPEEVYQWLCDDLSNLEEVALDESGLHGRLQEIRNCDNPICIRGPAELQEKDLIPKQYFDKKSDYSKHFRARRFEHMENDKYVDFYGMYSIQFILLGQDVLASYGVIYDFINGRPIEVRTRRQHYADVVGIEVRRSSREIEGDDQNLYVEGTPSLRISLTNDEKIDITYPNDEYYRQMAGSSFAATQLDYDPRRAADSANRAVHERVNIAKRNREISGHESM